MTYSFKPAAVLLALLGAAEIAFAIVGEQIHDFIVPIVGLGLSIAADCSKTLYYRNKDDPTLYVTNKDGTLIDSFPTVDADTGLDIILGEMAWDKGRGKLWAGQIRGSNDPVQVYLLDPTTGSATFQFTAVGTRDWPVGLAYDGTDGTVWVSLDDQKDIYHYEADGTPISVITPTHDISGTVLDISGVIVGVGDLLYVAREGKGRIFKVKKSDGSFISSFASFDGGENFNTGLECDVKSFAPKTVIWSKDYRGGKVRAIEVDPGTCTCGAVDPGHNGGGNGDPHFTTWLGGRFDYHGECDLVLLHSSNFESGVGLDVHIRTQKIHEKFSYISRAALRIGTDVLEVASRGIYYLNGVAGANMPNEISGFSVTHTQPSDDLHVFDVKLYNNGHERIKIKTYRDFVSVWVEKGKGIHFGDSVGLMGDFSMGQMLARDGKTVIDDPNAFGQEWQVLDREPTLFQTVRFPQHPQVCTLPTPKQTSALRRRLSESTVDDLAAEEACAQWGKGKEACIYDVLMTGDLGMAAVGAY
jgi:hypothetical protein